MIWYIKNLYWRIERIIRWIPVIWKNREFDHVYFLQIIAFKLKQMEKFYRSKYAISADRKDCATKIHICRLLCNRLIEDEYYDMLQRKIEFHWGSSSQIKVLDEGCQLGICKDWVHYDDYMQKQDLEYLCKLLRKHLHSWWD